MHPYFFEWMLNESNLFLNLFYYLLTRGYWLPKSQGGNLGGEIALHLQGWKLYKYLRDAWGERLSQGCSFIWQCCDPEHCGGSSQDHPGKTCWTVRGSPEKHRQNQALKPPMVHLKYVVCVISDTEVSLKSSCRQWREWLRVGVTPEYIDATFSSSFQKVLLRVRIFLK